MTKKKKKTSKKKSPQPRIDDKNLPPVAEAEDASSNNSSEPLAEEADSDTLCPFLVMYEHLIAKQDKAALERSINQLKSKKKLTVEVRIKLLNQQLLLAIIQVKQKQYSTVTASLPAILMKIPKLTKILETSPALKFELDLFLIYNAHAVLGYAYLQQNQLEEAKQAFSQSAEVAEKKTLRNLDEEPTDHINRYMLLSCAFYIAYNKQRNFDDAASIFQKMTQVYYKLYQIDKDVHEENVINLRIESEEFLRVKIEENLERPLKILHFSEDISLRFLYFKQTLDHALIDKRKKNFVEAFNGIQDALKIWSNFTSNNNGHYQLAADWVFDELMQLCPNFYAEANSQMLSEIGFSLISIIRRKPHWTLFSKDWFSIFKVFYNTLFLEMNKRPIQVAVEAGKLTKNVLTLPLDFFPADVNVPMSGIFKSLRAYDEKVSQYHVQDSVTKFIYWQTYIEAFILLSRGLVLVDKKYDAIEVLKAAQILMNSFSSEEQQGFEEDNQEKYSWYELYLNLQIGILYLSCGAYGLAEGYLSFINQNPIWQATSLDSLSGNRQTFFTLFKTKAKVCTEALNAQDQALEEQYVKIQQSSLKN